MKIIAILLATLLLASPVNAARAKVSMPVGRPLTFESIVHAASRYDVPLAPLLGILATENGRLGEALGNKNGTWDLGPFQVNTCHLNDLSEIGFTPEAIMIVGKGKYLLSRESYDSGPWRIARTPIQFALAHGLLNGPNGFPCKPEDVFENGMPFLDSPALGQCVFKKEAAAQVLQKQLGEPFADLDSLSPVRKAMAAAFILYALGKKHECIAILDDVSASYSENGGVPQCPLLENGDFSAALDEVLLAWASFSSRKAVARHLSYQLPLFMALLGEARKKGVLATSQFIWLRPLDRPLWYALNQCGGRAAWTEALAAWAHFQAEEHAGKTLSAPHIDAAVESLKNSLESQGWLKRDYDPFYQNITIQKENSESVVFAPAEEETEQ